jgi:hypothetical protein
VLTITTDPSDHELPKHSVAGRVNGFGLFGDAGEGNQGIRARNLLRPESHMDTLPLTS